MGLSVEDRVTRIIAYRREGMRFKEIAQRVQRSAETVEKLWKTYATAEDFAVSRSARGFEPEPVAPRPKGDPFDGVQFADDPRAVQQCRQPVYVPARSIWRSPVGSSAALTVGEA